MAMDYWRLVTSAAPKSQINVTPLVDVMLVLLIIMMLVAPMLQKGVDVKLPLAANTSDKPENEQQTVLAVDARDKFYVNSIEVPRAEMADRVKKALEEKTERVVLIKGDTDASYRAIMAAMDDLRKAGIEDIGLITDPKVDPNAPRRSRWEGNSHETRAQAFRRGAGRQGGNPSRQLGDERHAAHRRAARAPHHLHGGASAQPEGRRRQPAARGQQTAQKATPSEQIVVEYNADRSIAVNKQPVTLANLQEKLRDVFETRREKTMFIVGDPTLRYGEIIAVIDAGRGAGVEKVGIVTEGMRRGE